MTAVVVCGDTGGNSLRRVSHDAELFLLVEDLFLLNVYMCVANHLHAWCPQKTALNPLGLGSGTAVSCPVGLGSKALSSGERPGLLPWSELHADVRISGRHWNACDNRRCVFSAVLPGQAISETPPCTSTARLGASAGLTKAITENTSISVCQLFKIEELLCYSR